MFRGKACAVMMMRLIRATVARMRLPHNKRDLYGYGWIGYQKAVETYSPENSNISFESYAQWKIKYAIIDGIRREDPKKDRIVRKAKKIIGHRKDLYLGDVIRDLDPMTESLCVENTEIPTRERGFDIVDTRLLLAFGFSRLSAREISIIWLSFYRGDTLKKIGESMNLTESGVSMIRKEALDKMKQAMTYDEV